MNELRPNIDAIKAELAKPEVLATLRMVTPDLYAHVTAVVAVYDAFVRQREMQDQMTFMRNQIMMDKESYMRQLAVKVK